MTVHECWQLMYTCLCFSFLMRLLFYRLRDTVYSPVTLTVNLLRACMEACSLMLPLVPCTMPSLGPAAMLML